MVTALYRRYRPETFAEMIGQSQVTEPLMTALRTDRVNHAYLFSGPRGCGKTTSARILARCLNCAEGPTDVPCGVCASCIELSRDGGGSLDVVEIDAASHGGIDDARDLRERATFAPARDRFKIFIIDEAHMVTSGGFNALLKIVEEPPEHVKFIFATTEPDKVLGTIRSRTHHYPFRLVPPAPMLEYVQQLCADEGITVEPGVLALVVRAGGGSPRDTLSLLDQLMAGSEGTTIDYERAVALLGYTHGALLDEVVDAIGARDAAGAFAAADRVVQTGQDPRRFVEDLLERLRDLIVVAATSPEAAAAVLRGVPEDELARMATQAAAFGPAELSRVADLVNQTLTEMTGATSPRLHLELMLARVLVPSADDSERGALARVERLERRVGVSDAVRVDEPPVVPVARPAAQPTVARPAAQTDAGRGAAQPDAGRGAAQPRIETPAGGAAVGNAASAGPDTQAPPMKPPQPIGPVTLQQIRDAWPEVLAVLQRTKRTAWMAALTAQVIEFRADDEVLVLGFTSTNDVQGLRAGSGNQNSAELLRSAIHEVLGVTVKFLPRVIGAKAQDDPPGDGGAASGAPAPSSPGAPAPIGSAPTASAPPASAPSAPAPSASAQSAPAPTASGGTAPAAAPTARANRAAPATDRSANRTAPASPVDSWATVAIPRDPATDSVDPTAAAATAPQSRTATAVAERDAPAPEAIATPAVSADDVPPLDESAAPPEDFEPPFDPGPEPEVVLEASAPTRTAAPAAPATSAPRASRAPSKQRRPATTAAATDGGIQRYGEAVVREVLGATFLEETEAPPARTGFGGAWLTVYEGIIQELIDELGRLPGIGPKSAQRIAFHIVQTEHFDVSRLAEILLQIRDKVRFCEICGNVSEQATCTICRDPRRDPASICVVEEAKDVVAIERTREFRGLYHVLGGAISPIDGIGPDELRIRQLMQRLADGTVTEVIIATDPNLEGEATATYLSRLLTTLEIRVTRLASGLPVGGDLEYADEVTLGRAFEGRRVVG